MRKGLASRLLTGLAAGLVAVQASYAANVLFDATKHEMAGNADWVIDADAWNQNMPAYPCTGSTNESNPARFPTPSQAGITPATPETYWTGGISSWAVDLAKAGHNVETLPAGAAITFGDGSNPQDLSNYKLFVVVEPQNPFTAGEKAAILAFVNAGGGLFMVADHETSDRDCDGWDAPHVYNDLTGATSASAAGVFGIWFRVNGLEDKNGEDWFDDGVDANVETSPLDPIVNGPFGSGAGGLGLFGSTSMDLNPADNAGVAAHVWRTGQAHGNLRVTFATATYGAGRVAAIGDSSPADDDTGDSGDSLYPGWDKAAGGVANREIHLNACHWLINPAPDLDPPAILSGPSANPGDCAATISWTTDEAATSLLDYGTTAAYGSAASVSGFAQVHGVNVTPLSAGTEYHYRVSSSDPSGNGPTSSGDATFTTAAAAAPVITVAPSVSGIGGSTATISFNTDEPSSSSVEYGTTIDYGSTATGASGVADHHVTLSALAAETGYHYRVLTTDGCGNGPTASADGAFTTGPAAIDLSGWTVQQQVSAIAFVIPAGTMLPSGGYLVIGRNASRAEFLAAYPSMPAGTVYLNSNANGSCSAAGCFPQVNGDETFALVNPANAPIDGPTIAMATTHRSYQRAHPGDAAGVPASWNVLAEASANPGAGAGTGSASGVRINEMSDASDFTKEFVELYYDTTPAGPDPGPPAAVSDLSAVPQSASSVLLTWTAVGDDGVSGTAASYDVRRSAQRILTNAEFAAATSVPGAPAPQPAGSAESMPVSGLNPDTPYYFAVKVVDDAANVSPLSNGASATTGLPGGGGSPVNHLVISQFRVAGSTDDVVELYNPTGAAISLSGTSIQYLAANGNFGFRVNLTAANSVPAHGWYLAAANGYAGSPVRDESLATSNMSNGAGHVLLVGKISNTTCTDATNIDKVGYGATATCAEGGSGHQVATPGSGLADARKPGGIAGNGQDTDVNGDDFLAPASPTFRNRFSTPASPPTGLGNVKDTLFVSKGAGIALLSWANAAGATGYRVYRGTAPGFMGGTPAPWATPAGNAVSDGEAAAPVFFYLVHATDGTAESSE